MEILLTVISIVLSSLCLVALVFLVLAMRKKGKAGSGNADVLVLKESLDKTQELVRQSLLSFQETTSLKLEHLEKEERLSLENAEKTLRDNLQALDSAMQELRKTQEDKLTEIRAMVDEKLQKALDERLAASFKSVSEQLSGVYKAVGEMTRIGQDVSSLKNVLTNVKTRGILGEIQLGNILKDILTPEQYECNVPTKRNSRDVVEFAIRLPGKEEKPVYLPIDSKFPLSPYEALLSAREEGDKERIEACQKQLRIRLFSFAKDIQEKYLDVPNTTDFAVLFLPMESLYEEALSLDLLAECQQKCHVVLSGPSTLSAFLNALSMGFKTIAIERKTSEVYALLGRVKQEFGKFAEVLSSALKSLDQTRNRLEDLIGVRTRMIESSLRAIALDNTPKTETHNATDIPVE